MADIEDRIFNYKKAYNNFFNKSEKAAKNMLTHLEKSDFGKEDALTYKIIQSYQNNNFNDFRLHIHSLKGNISYFYGEDLKDKCEIAQNLADKELF